MSEKKTLNTAVIGTGYLGNFHAQKYAALPEANLVGICDIDKDRARDIANKLNTTAYHNYHDLIGKVDAISIATPTPYHFTIAKFFLENGVHILLEKPITQTLEEADELIKIAKEKKVVFQVGHLERFNTVVTAAKPFLTDLRFIESTRLAPFQLRGTDVNVVLDLMIHDIDIIQTLVNDKIKHISATGASVLSPLIDLGNARIEFENGCIANVTASRISTKKQRSLKIFQTDAYISLDLQRKSLSIHRRGKKEMYPGIPEIIRENHRYDQGDSLKDQTSAFLNSILNNEAPVVSGYDGRRALEIALKITDLMREHKNWDQLTKQ